MLHTSRLWGGLGLLLLLLVGSLVVFPSLWHPAAGPDPGPAVFTQSPPQPTIATQTSSPTLPVTGRGGSQETMATAAACKDTLPLKQALRKAFFLIDDTAVNPRYLNEAGYTLCFDKWDYQAVQWIKIGDVLTHVGWPEDLLQQPYPLYEAQVFPRGDFSKIIEPRQVPRIPQVTTPTTPTNSNGGQFSCPQGFFFDPCKMYADTVKAFQGSFGDTLTQLQDILWTTPAKSSYNNPTLKPFWDTSLILVGAALAGVIAWAALRHMLGVTFGSWLSYADLLELFPRLAFGLLAAFCSLRFCQWIVDLSNELATFWNPTMLSSITQGTGNDGVILTFQLVYIVMGFLLLLEAGARYALLFILIAFSPLWMFAASLRETAAIAKAGAKAFVLLVFLQPAQMAVLALGGATFAALVKNPGQLTVLYILVGIAIMLIVLLMFFSVAQQIMGGLAAPVAAAATGLAGYVAGRGGAGVKGAVKWTAKKAGTMAFAPVAYGVQQAGRIEGYITRPYARAGSARIMAFKDSVKSGVKHSIDRTQDALHDRLPVLPVSNATYQQSLRDSIHRRAPRGFFTSGQASSTIAQTRHSATPTPPTGTKPSTPPKGGKEK